jgi:hypothetical protein
MEQIIGYAYCIDTFPIIKKDNGIFWSAGEELPKEMLQYAMVNPWDKCRVRFKEEDNGYIVRYFSDVYDGISYEICGRGDILEYAIEDCIENVLDVMQGYDEVKVEEFMDNYKKEEEKIIDKLAEIELINPVSYEDIRAALDKIKE